MNGFLFFVPNAFFYRLPPPSFMKKKRRKKDGQESDASDSGMMDSAGPISPYGDGQDTQDGLVPVSSVANSNDVTTKMAVYNIYNRLITVCLSAVY